MNRLFLAVLLSLILGAPAGAADPREASAILKDYESVKEPVVDATKVKDPAYVRSYREERKRAMEKKDALAMELFQAHPGHPRTVTLMHVRWSNMIWENPRVEKAIAEMDAYLKD